MKVDKHTDMSNCTSNTNTTFKSFQSALLQRAKFRKNLLAVNVKVVLAKIKVHGHTPQLITVAILV